MKDANYYREHPEELQYSRIMGMTNEERETVITIPGMGNLATISTTDNKMFTYLKKRPAFSIAHLYWGRDNLGKIELHEVVYMGPANLIRISNGMSEAQKQQLLYLQKQSEIKGTRFQKQSTKS